MLKTIVRTGQVLELFTRSRPEWGVTEIASALGVPKSNAHEIVSSLASIDLLRRTGRSRYRLGWRIMTMASEVVEARALRQHAPEHMRRLARATHETCHLAVWDGRRLIFVARALGVDGIVQQHAEAGNMLVAHCSASGKVLLADLPWDEVVDRVERGGGLVARTPNSITSFEALRDELTLVGDRGWGANREEADLGVSGVAVAVRQPDGRPVAALSVSVARERFDGLVQLHLPLIRKVARQLEKAIADEIALAAHEDPREVDSDASPAEAERGASLVAPARREARTVVGRDATVVTV
ncbi:IclR family transcriptional regulator [Nocardioides pantholopis]|uniref:IclR family transcriptional regulator n=1 Tax=Nocardioides pantholopis TaxID=2483798 RepID=UPI0013E3514F|nr:IclR family transcriptional regulator [Nocardioides pantholopis]